MKRSLAVGLVVVAIVAGGAAGWGITRVDHHHKSLTGGKAPVAASIKIIDFRTGASKEGPFITTPAKVDQLTGTSTAFKQFVATNVQKMINANDCPGAARGITVDKYATSGYASGSVNECGGYAAIWGLKNGVWKELIGTQDIWYCAELYKDGVPSGLLDDGKCYDESTRKVVQYAGWPADTSVKVTSYVTKASPNGLALYKASDVSQLTGTTAAFKEFVANSIQKVQKDAGKGACSGAPIGIDVFAYSTNGFASGAADVCGGYQALWGVKDGVWKQLIATQGGWVCSELHKLGAPRGILGSEQCADTKTNKLIDYQG